MTVDRLSSPLLSGARRLSALDTVRVRIAMAVDLGLLKPDERLPDTKSVAAALDVSEITVRRGLVSLTDDGVLTRRRGRDGGTYVASQPIRGAVAEISTYADAADEVHQLIDRRLVIETGIVALAARTPAEVDLHVVERLVDRMDTASTWADFHLADEEFHLAVARTTGIAGAVDQLRPVLHDLYRFYLPYPLEYLRGSNREHRSLVNALRDRDAAAAVRVTHDHVHCLHETMFVGLQAQ
ncbi:GntR family transcriptional regulator [Gordonia sp. TBRC 11910]|uniref:GntR family transcriptional regulator n=1 Tax=Gordonia asplenii TaxID=2725283 RepID=A0A848KU37_9ACTN|nr:FCD domain-containing protein [Gordonia asplenii]NMO01507.1 GntR family transcriptional regulator [Gordonia asplenii]